METVIIILNGTVTLNVFVVFTRNCKHIFPIHNSGNVFIVLAKPVGGGGGGIAVDMVEGYYS